MYAYAGWTGPGMLEQSVREFGGKGQSEHTILKEVQLAFPEVFGEGLDWSRLMMEAQVAVVNGEGNYNAFLFIIGTDDGRLVTERIW